MATEEELKAEQERISKIVNDAVTAQFGRKMPSMVADAVKAGLGDLKLDEHIGAAVAKAMPQQGQQGQGGGTPPAGGQAPTQPQVGGQPSPEMVAMSAKLADMQKKLEEQTKRTADEAAKARNEKRDSLLNETLSKINVDPNRRRGAAAVIREGAVWDEASSSWQYKAKRDGYEEQIPLDQYVAKEWAATDEGKSYITASPARGGAGTRPAAPAAMGGAARRMPADPKAERAQQEADATTALFEQAAALVGGGTIAIGSPLGGGGSGQ